MTDYRNVIVQKPWGREYLVYDNGVVAVWCLEIKAGHSTSMHAHPNKLTGLVLCEGRAAISFLNGRQIYEPLHKMMIHPHVFHQTYAVSDAVILETETPTDKTDLVRIKDEYGREGKPYESGLELIERGDQVQRPMGPFDARIFGNAEVTLCGLWGHENTERSTIYIFLNGGMFSPKGVPVVAPGHVVWSHDLKRLVEVAELKVGSVVLEIEKQEGP